MLSFFLGALAALAVVWIVRWKLGFRGQTPEHYRDDTPVFDLRRHLNGKMSCDGVVYGPLGRVVSRFSADFETSWDARSGVMREVFRYDSGEMQTRAWFLELAEDGGITATADDVIGTGQGWQSGPTVQLSYRMKLDEDAGGHVLDVVDWMYLTPDGTIMNRSQFRKYGIKVAELIATMRPKETA